MHRRIAIAALACWRAGPLLAQEDSPRPRLKISAGELQKALTARFPLRVDLNGWITLRIDAPQLLLLPARQRVGATLAIQIDAAGLQQAGSGEMDVAFALRYAPQDRTVRARDLEVLALRWPGLTADARQAIQALLPEVAREAVGEFVLHSFSPRDLALADTMGFEPEKIVVTSDGLIIEFRPRPLAAPMPSR